MFQLIKIITKSFLIGFLFFSFQGISQTSDQKMAIYYFEEGDFEKAKMYYVKVFETNQSRNTYSNYFTTLIELKEYKEAEKITKKIIKL